MKVISDYLSSKIIQWLEEKVKENPLYQKITGNILIVSSNNSELNQLLEESIKIARLNEIVASLNDNEIIESIDKNIDIISECIIFSKSHLSLSNFLSRIKYVNHNEEHYKQIETFFKSLFEQIYNKKQNYPTLQNIQIQNELGYIREEINSGFSSNNAKLDQILSVLSITGYEPLDYNEELNEIEHKLKNREFTLARETALAFEKKINENKKQEEIEKLYALIINSYLFEGGNQEGALEYFDKLIANTKDDKKKKSRYILQQIISRNFQNAQAELIKIFKNTKYEETDSSFYENQINLYFLSEDFSAGYDFIINNKDKIENYLYFLALMLVQQCKFEDANNLWQDHQEYFNKEEFEIQEIKVLIRSHALLLELRKTTTIDIISELKVLSVEIKTLVEKAGDCKIKKSYLISVNAIILAALFDTESAKAEYEKALELDPDNYNVYKNYPYLLLSSFDDKNKALELLEKYRKKYPYSLDDEIIYFSILTEINPERVIEEISARKDVEIEIYIYLIYALDKINQHKKAETYLNEILLKYNNFSVHFCFGYHFFSLNKPEIAIESFMKAYTFCKNETHYNTVFYYLLRIICSEHYLDKMNTIRNWLEDKYNREILLLKYPQYYIHILLVQNDYLTCIACCDDLRERGINEDYIAIAEFTCYYNTKNFQKVKQVLDENRIKYSDEILIRMAYACASIGEYELTKDILFKIKKPESKEDYIVHARLFFSIKEYHSSLETISKAYLKFPDDRNIQEFFINLVYNHHIQPQSNDINNSFGNCLQAYRMADYKNKILQEVSIPKNANGEDILKLIAKQFPVNQDIDKRVETIHNYRLPISLYKSIFRKSLFSIHDMVIHSKNSQIWCTEQFENELSHIKLQPLYIDLSSLITIELLGLLDTVKILFPRIYFSQSILDTILSFDNELSEPYCEHVILNYGKRDNFFIKRSNNEIITDMKNKIVKLKSFVLSGDNIEIIGSVLSPKKVIIKKIEDFLENLAKTEITESDTMRFGYLSDYQTMIENVALRAAFNTFPSSPLGFGIDSLLKYLLENNLISEDKYFFSLTTLIENNYKQIPVSVKHMLFVIKSEGYNIIQKHNKLFSFFASGEFNFEQTITMLANLLSHIWNDIAPSENKKWEWTDYLLGIIALNPLMNNENGYQILNYVKNHIITKQNSLCFIKYIENRMKIFNSTVN